MFVSKRFIGAALLAASFSAHAHSPAIEVDGQADDWAGVPVLAAASGQNAQSVKAVVSGNYLYVIVQGSQMGANTNLLIDTDNNPASGFQAGASWSSSGADYLVAAGRVLRSTAADWQWADVDAARIVASSTVIEAQIPLAALGLNASTAASIRLGVQNASAGWTMDSVLPKASALVKLTPEVAPAPVSGPAFAVGKGLIVPAYLTLDDADAGNWNLLKEGAALVKGGSNPAVKDFWVAVNSDANGPFREDAKWLKAKAYWDPIRANGGRIFGYIHTVQSPDMSTPEGRRYRDLASVQADITAWVKGYPNLDGLWIDEFYPRYEIAQPEASVLVYPRDYPNGAALAPTDRGFINELGQFNGKQVNPLGGYYQQLTSWIRATYPQLRLIGNAGGDLYSNQYLYGDLVDVLVSFEQNFDVAYETGSKRWDVATQSVIETERYQWHGLDRLNDKTTAPGFLALIHGNSGNMALGIDQALKHGYTHVYTTDRVLRAGSADNVWGGVASYLMSEIEYLLAAPPAAAP